MTIILKAVDEQNWRQCIKLKVRKDQKMFVASNLYSLAEAKYDPFLVPLAIYNDALMVGFVMYGQDPEDGRYWIVRMMIDESHQKKGYGKVAMKELIKQFKELKDCKCIYIGYKPDNGIVGKFYKILGFKKTGEILHGEIIAKLELNSE